MELSSSPEEYTFCRVTVPLTYKDILVLEKEYAAFEQELSYKGLMLERRVKDLMIVHPIFAKRGGKRTLIGYYDPTDQQNINFELSWLLDPAHRLTHLRKEWQEVSHAAASQIDAEAIVAEATADHAYKAEGLDVFLLLLDKANKIAYRHFANYVKRYMEIRVATTHYTYENSVEGVLSENATFVVGLMHYIFSTLYREALTEIGEMDLGEFLNKLDFDNLKQLMRKLAIAPNGTLGTNGLVVRQKYLFNLDMDAFTQTQKFSFVLSSAWEGITAEALLKREQQTQGTKQLFSKLKPYSEVCMFLEDDMGFKAGSTGLCPLYFDSEDFTHTYDVFVNIIEELKDKYLWTKKQ